MSINKYSIILPVKNGGEYFKQCVQSILAQTFPHFNLHILDNCSLDGSKEWVQSLKDERIIMIPSSSPLSIEENWARIISIQKNEFITLIGHDDLLYPYFLATVDSMIAAYPEASLYQTHFNLIDNDGKEIRKCKPMPQTEKTSDFFSAFLQHKMDLFGTGYVMRAADYDRLGGIPSYPSLLFADFELWSELTGISFKVNSPRECFSYRIHASTTRLSSDTKMQQAFERLILYLKKTAEKDPSIRAVIQKNAVNFLNNYCKGIAHRLLRTPASKRGGLTVKNFINNCKQYAELLAPEAEFKPHSIPSIAVASFIDSNALLRELFLWFKKILPKPVLK